MDENSLLKPEEQAQVDVYFKEVDGLSKDTWQRIYKKGIAALNNRLNHKTKPVFKEYSSFEELDRFVDWLNTLEEPIT